MILEARNINCTQCQTRAKSIFCELDRDEVQRVSVNKKVTFFKKGETIFKEGSYPHGLYCVHNGKVKVSQTGPDGKEQIVHLAKTGDVMGYRAILSGDKYSCSAKAMEDSTLCFIPVNLFTELIEKNGKFNFRVLRLLSNELKMAERTITAIAQKSVRERVAQSILLLKENYDFEEDGRTINVAVTREDIAGIVGTARESVIRTLFEFKNDRIIELRGKKIRILDYPRLLEEANMA